MSPSSEDEVNNAPAAYNNSIYLMVGVPYLSLAVVGFFIYRGCKKNAAYFENLRNSPSQNNIIDQ